MSLSENIMKKASRSGLAPPRPVYLIAASRARSSRRDNGTPGDRRAQINRRFVARHKAARVLALSR